MLERAAPSRRTTSREADDVTNVPEGEPYAGVFPIAPTPFTAAGALDLEGQRRVLDCMVDQGVAGICILANYSEQFLLRVIGQFSVHRCIGT